MQVLYLLACAVSACIDWSFVCACLRVLLALLQQGIVLLQRSLDAFLQNSRGKVTLGDFLFCRDGHLWSTDGATAHSARSYLLRSMPAPLAHTAVLRNNV